MPMISAPVGSTKPDAGVMATRPATAPEQMPSSDGVPRSIHSTNIQVSAAVAVAICVTAMAMPALPPAVTAEPALKPNQPPHSSDAPIMVSTRLSGDMLSLPRHLSMPSPPSQPPPQTQCAIGEYTNSDHRPMNHSLAENFMRSAKAPAISAGG